MPKIRRIYNKLTGILRLENVEIISICSLELQKFSKFAKIIWILSPLTIYSKENLYLVPSSILMGRGKGNFVRFWGPKLPHQLLPSSAQLS